VAIGYPNTYYVGMSNVGFQAVYRFWNDEPDVVCERFFLPDRADREELRRSEAPLVTLESGTPVRDFDVVAFSVTFEPDELNLISMLDLAGIPALASERNERHPLVVAGGPVTFLNPEPLAPFLDVIAVGEAEALLPPLTEALRSVQSRTDLFQRLEDVGGFYVPAHFEIDYRPDGTIAQRRNRVSAGPRIVRAKMGKHLRPHLGDGDVEKISDRDLSRLPDPLPILLGGIQLSSQTLFRDRKDPGGGARSTCPYFRDRSGLYRGGGASRDRSARSRAQGDGFPGQRLLATIRRSAPRASRSAGGKR
jgi:radical SAM superfamily enzyme YgiQ (UPF0313 family)